MATTPTRSDIFAAGRRFVTIRPSGIRREMVDTPGSTIRALLGAGATMTEEVAIFASQAYNETRLGTAAKVGGDVLDRAIFDRFGRDIEPRRSASVARVYLSFSRPAIGVGFTLAAGFRCATGDGMVFSTLADAVFLPDAVGPIRVIATCQTAGPAGNVAVATITKLVDRAEDPATTVTNPEAAAGGAEAETDEAFYARAQRYWAGARRGTPAAVELGAVSTPGVEAAEVVEQLDPINFEPIFRARVVIAGENGAANRALAELTKERLEEYRALGVPVAVIAGQPLEIEIVVSGVVFIAGANTTTVIEQMRQAIVAAVNVTAPGQTLYRQTIWSALEKFSAYAKVPLDGLVEPAGDLAPPTVQTVIMTRGHLITITSA